MSERDVTPPKLPNVSPKLIILVVVVVVIAGFGLSSFYVVDQTEEAVVLFLGKYNRTTGAGLHFKIPLLEQNYNVPTQVVQVEEFGFRTEQSGVQTRYSSTDFPEESLMLTGDLNIVDVEWILQYRIADPQAWLFNVEDKHRTIRDISQSTLNMLVGDRAILDVIGSERTNIEIQANERMNEIFDEYGLGIRVTQVRLQNIVPPAGEVQDAFEDVNRAIQDMNRAINRGQEAYNQAIPEARGQAQQVVQEARGYANERVNEAEGNIARFNSVLSEYLRSPDVTRTRLYYEMMEDVFEDAEGTELIDRSLDNFLPFLSLEQGRTQSIQGGPQ